MGGSATCFAGGGRQAGELLEPGDPSPTALKLAPLDETDASFAVDYHMHTTYTDGSASPAAIVQIFSCSMLLAESAVRRSSQQLSPGAADTIVTGGG